MSEYILEIGRKHDGWARKEEIVRCKDCAHWATEARFTGMCVGKQFNPDGFCAWGERRGE